MSLKPLVRKPIRYTFPLLHPGAERCGEGGDTTHDEGPPVHYSIT